MTQVPRHAHFELIPLSDRRRWSVALIGIWHSSSHSWMHCNAFALSSGLPTYLLYFQEGDARVVCPLSERTYLGERDVFTPFGFAGFAASHTVSEFGRLWKDFATKQGWVCAYIQGSPLVLDPLSTVEGGIVHNAIQFLDLSRTEDELLAKMSPTRRRQLTHPSKREYQLFTASDEAADFVIHNAEAFFTSRSASSVYRFNPRTWRALLASDSVLALEARRDHKIKSVSIFGAAGHIPEYLFNISAEDNQRASTWLVWEAIQRLRKAGYKFVNLGGGVRPGDGISQFKRRFGTNSVPLLHLRQIFRRGMYENLCRHANACSTGDEKFFPRYHSRVVGRFV